MSRPSWQECLPEAKYYAKDNYVVQVEEYCDEVESKLELAVGTVVILDEKLNLLEKAIEKITKAIDEHYNCPPNIDYCKDTKCGDCWKRWAMKDE